jgi:hypothetical protein
VATIVILFHELQKGLNEPYIVRLLADAWRDAGHRVHFHFGTDNLPPADIAVLHVDMTVAPPDYVAALADYPYVINGAVRDIGKRSFSTCLLERDSDWSGPVILKTNENDSGRPEARLRQRATETARGDIQDSPLLPTYPVYDALSDVPEHVWADLRFVVEKFLPERDERGYHVRIWTFLGDRERSHRYCSDAAIVKPRATSSYNEPVTVPDEIRSWRKRLGFDYGKFDFVCPDGQPPVLIDVNRTPCISRNIDEFPDLLAGYHALSRGIEAFIPATSRAAPPLPA